MILLKKLVSHRTMFICFAIILELFLCLSKLVFFSHVAYKSAIREQKLALEISAAKRERDFYLSKVDQSRALSSIEERMKKVNNLHFNVAGRLLVVNIMTCIFNVTICGLAIST